MRPGDLDTLLTPQTPSTSYASGVGTTTYANGTAFWGRVAEMSARERIRAGQATGDLPAVLTFRADDATLTTNHRVTDGVTTWELVSTPRPVAGPRGHYAEALLSTNADGGA